VSARFHAEPVYEGFRQAAAPTAHVRFVCGPDGPAIAHHCHARFTFARQLRGRHVDRLGRTANAQCTRGRRAALEPPALEIMRPLEITRGGSAKKVKAGSGARAALTIHPHNHIPATITRGWRDTRKRPVQHARGIPTPFGADRHGHPAASVNQQCPRSVKRGRRSASIVARRQRLRHVREGVTVGAHPTLQRDGDLPRRPSSECAFGTLRRPRRRENLPPPFLVRHVGLRASGSDLRAAGDAGRPPVVAKARHRIRCDG
jgi:hypothetical protein